MTDHRAKNGYHDGELYVQQRAGVHVEARRLNRMLDPPELTTGIARFLAQRTLVVVTARDEHGQLWTSPLVGPSGFLEVIDGGTLHIHSVPRVGDPLHRLKAGQPVGLVAIELASSRRFRINGRLTGADQVGLTVDVDQAYGNCPQYIQRRVLRADSMPVAGLPNESSAPTGTALAAVDIEWIQAADTLFLGTTHPTRGNDASHRGGPAGFVRVENERSLWWPDYPGNNMFNSLGNISVDPTASLLFLEFTTGRSLHLGGRAALDFIEVGAGGDDALTGRVVRFAIDLITHGPPLPIRGGLVAPYERNPPLRN